MVITKDKGKIQFPRNVELDVTQAFSLTAYSSSVTLYIYIYIHK